MHKNRRSEYPAVRTAKCRKRIESDWNLKTRLNRPYTTGRFILVACYFCVLSFLCASALNGCAKKKVYLPRDWQTPAPQQVDAGPSSKQDAPPTASQPNALLLKRPAAIKESDVPLGGEDAPEAAKKSPPAEQPERLASMHLVEQAQVALAQGKPDAAIPLLEKAIQVDVYNGEAFFGLARAWRMKGSRQKSLEFARKAEIIFQDDHPKLKEVYLFEADVYKEMGDNKKTDQYRQKASKL